MHQDRLRVPQMLAAYEKLSTRDDGRGFTTPPAGDGYGLAGMRNRVEQVAGALWVGSSCGATGGGADRMISVLLVDDHPVVRAGVRGMLAGEPGITVVGESASAANSVAPGRSPCRRGRSTCCGWSRRDAPMPRQVLGLGFRGVGRALGRCSA
jgi:hypothetical protein